jgi:hypothetical protein
MNTAYLQSNRTKAGDECYTPFYAVAPLLEFVPKNKRIWCPFDEDWSAYFCSDFLPEKLIFRELQKFQRPLKGGGA